MAPTALTQPAREALGVLACCPDVPTDVFAQLVRAGHPVSTYQLLARLRARGLATSKPAVLGPLLGSGICRLWSLTPHGREALLTGGSLDASQDVGNAAFGRKGKSPTNERVASYRALAGLIARESASGQAVRLLCWESPWVGTLRNPQTARSSHVRLSGGARLNLGGGGSVRKIQALLLADLGTTPVSKHQRLLDRLARFRAAEPNWEAVLVVVTFDPGGTGARIDAWRSLIASAARHGRLEARFTT
jgi:hypothetical protein